MDQSRVTESQLKRVLVSEPKTGITISKAHVYQQGNCFSSKVPKDEHWLCPVSPVPASRNGNCWQSSKFQSHWQEPFVGNSV